MTLKFLDPEHPEQAFPNPANALQDPNGLLAMGGCLSPQRLLTAYRQGIFPWYNPGEPILWWSPNPRLVLFPDQLHISRSLKKTIRKQDFEISYDTDFNAVIHACATPRDEEGGTWITEEMIAAYCRLHSLGIAHSVEARVDQQLVGGLYGLAIGKVFFGESMFSYQSNASKTAFVHLVQDLLHCGFQLIDCQVHTDHLISLGAVEINRQAFNTYLAEFCCLSSDKTPWVTA